MKLLAIETSTPSASVAVVHGESVIARLDDSSGNHSDRLISLVDRCLEDASTDTIALDAIVVGGGPGSFTGLRIGMATAKGLALGVGCPLWTVSSLAALAAEAECVNGIETIAVVADARRKEVFVGLFAANDLRPLGNEQVLPPERVAESLAGLGARTESLALIGEGLQIYPEISQAIGATLIESPQRPSAEGLSRIAISTRPSDGLIVATPTYIRPSEAEIRFPDGNPGGTFAPPSHAGKKKR